MKDKYSQYFNKGNDCDTCENQYLCGEYGDATGCKQRDKGLECDFIEAEEYDYISIPEDDFTTGRG